MSRLIHNQINVNHIDMDYILFWGKRTEFLIETIMLGMVTILIKALIPNF